MNFLQRMMAKFQQFMVGRYGNDQFSLFLSITGLVLSVISNFFRYSQKLYWVGTVLYFIGALMILYSVFRSFSKNFEARRKELNWYLVWSEKPKQQIKLLINKIRDRKTHKYFTCKSCKTVMRVPKGRGKIEITCPKCRMKVIKKT